MTAPSPGILTRFIINLHYPTEDAYRRGARRRAEDRIPRHRRSGLRAADRRARSRLGAQQPVPPSQRRRIPHKIAERNIAALNAATEGLPADRMRLHICWGNYEGPHTHDLPLLEDHRHRLQGAAAGDQHRGRQPAPRPRMGRPEGRSTFPTTRFSSPASSIRPRISSSIRGWWRSASAATRR